MRTAQYIASTIKRLPWPTQGTVVVAVSGGPDSVCALRVCHAIAQVKGFSIHVAHLDHGLRGAESHDDAIFTQRLAEELGWPVTSAYRAVEQIKGYSGSLQQRCRTIRQDFLNEVVVNQEAVALVYGHNLDDQAETVIQHLMRGSGLKGLSGMRESDHQGGVLVLRPLLDISRIQIIELLKEWEQSYRQDPSNETDKYQRNHIRHHLLPYLRQEYNPNITQRIADMAAIIAHDDDLLQDLTDRALATSMQVKENMITLNRALLQQQPQAIQLRAMRRAYQRLNGSTEDLTYAHALEMISLLSEGHGKSLSLPNGITCEIIYTQLCLFYARDLYHESHDLAVPVMVTIPGLTNTAGGKRLSAIVHNSVNALEKMNKRVVFDLNRLKLPLAIRTRKPGDRFYPYKAPGSKKLKNFMIDLKIPRHLRDRQLLLVDGEDQILWIIGIRRSNYAIISANTQQILELSIGEDQ